MKIDVADIEAHLAPKEAIRLSGSVRLLYLGVDDGLLVDKTHVGSGWVSGIKGIFLGPESSFRNKLVRALWAS